MRDDAIRAPLTLSPKDQTQPPVLQTGQGSSRLASASMTRPRDEPAIHPGVDLPLLRDLIRPERSLWTPSQLRHLTRTVAAELTAPLLEVTRFVPEQRRPARLALTDGVELWLLSWRPGQDTGPHDHGGAYGSFTVLLGELTEDFTEDYRYLGVPSRSALREVGAAVGFGPKRAHRVRNLGTRDAASVHAYSPPLLPTREYASRADGLAGATPRLPTGQSARRRRTRCSRKHAQS